MIAPGGAGIVISSMAGHMFPPFDLEQEHALAHTPTDELLALPFLDPGQHGRRGLRLRQARQPPPRPGGEPDWGERGARVNAISPGIIITPLARDEMSGPGAENYQKMIETSATGRVGTPDEVAAAAAFLLGPEAGVHHRQRPAHGRRRHRCAARGALEPHRLTTAPAPARPTHAPKGPHDMSTPNRPCPEAEQRRRDARPRPRRLPDAPRRDPRRRPRRARRRVPAHRHRGGLRQRAPGRRGGARLRPGPVRGLPGDQDLDQRLRIRRDAARASRRAPASSASTRSTC